jgi:hypothetical protein
MLQNTLRSLGRRRAVPSGPASLNQLALPANVPPPQVDDASPDHQVQLPLTHVAGNVSVVSSHHQTIVSNHHQETVLLNFFDVRRAELDVQKTIEAKKLDLEMAKEENRREERRAQEAAEERRAEERRALEEEIKAGKRKLEQFQMRETSELRKHNKELRRQNALLAGRLAKDSRIEILVGQLAENVSTTNQLLRSIVKSGPPSPSLPTLPSSVTCLFVDEAFRTLKGPPCKNCMTKICRQHKTKVIEKIISVEKCEGCKENQDEGCPNHQEALNQHLNGKWGIIIMP